MDFNLVFHIGKKRDGTIQIADSVGRVFRFIEEGDSAILYFDVVE